MTHADRQLAAVARLWSGHGVQCGTALNGRVFVETLHMDLHARDTVLREAFGARAAITTFDLRAQGASSPGICVLSAGFGKTDDAALADAAFVWIHGVGLPVVSWALRSHVPRVSRVPLVARDDKTREKFGWTVHLSDLFVRTFGDTELGPPPRPDEAMVAISEAVAGHTAHRVLFWVECFASRRADGVIDATCRLRNEVWPDGDAALRRWTESWPSPRAGIITKRQFLLFEPTSLDEMTDLSSELDQRAPSG